MLELTTYLFWTIWMMIAMAWKSCGVLWKTAVSLCVLCIFLFVGFFIAIKFGDPQKDQKAN